MRLGTETPGLHRPGNLEALSLTHPDHQHLLLGSAHNIDQCGAATLHLRDRTTTMALDLLGRYALTDKETTRQEYRCVGLGRSGLW
jgi:hypothetical protein